MSNKKQPAGSALPSVLNEGEVLSLVNRVTKTARENQNELHLAAWQALAYAHKTNNANPLAILANDLPNSSRTDALMAWAKAFAPVSFHHQKNKKGELLYTMDGRPQLVVKLRKQRTDEDWQIADAFGVAFFDFRKPNVAKEVDFTFKHLLEGYIKRMSRMAAQGKGDVQAVIKQRELAEGVLASL